jgi:hypothetical protein
MEELPGFVITARRLADEIRQVVQGISQLELEIPLHCILIEQLATVLNGFTIAGLCADSIVSFHFNGQCMIGVSQAVTEATHIGVVIHQRLQLLQRHVQIRNADS